MYQYERFFKRLPRPTVRCLRNAYLSLLDLKDRIEGKSTGLIPPRSLHFIGGGDFEQIGNAFVSHFVNVGMLLPSETILDIGCGTGRMAIPLAKYMNPDGNYVGFDISKEAIDWCQRHIASRNPHFAFHYANIHNTEYNPDGTISAAEYRFPCDDNKVDFAYATSVFTHMRRSEVMHYLAELHRCLKPSGRAMLSFFVLDEQNVHLMHSGHAALNFVHDLGDCRTIDARTPERAVAYSPDVVDSMMSHAGLQLSRPIFYGSWSGRTSMLDAQDILFVTKPSAKDQKPNGQ